MDTHAFPPDRNWGSTPVPPAQDALQIAVELLAFVWDDCQKDLVAVIPIAVPESGPPETAPPPYFVAMADDREAGKPGSMAVALNAAVGSADRIARRMLAGPGRVHAWARVERGGAFNVIRERRPRSPGGGLPANAAAPPTAGTTTREGS
jgi:hypothetical protein